MSQLSNWLVLGGIAALIWGLIKVGDYYEGVVKRVTARREMRAEIQEELDISEKKRAKRDLKKEMRAEMTGKKPDDRKRRWGDR